MQILTIDSWDDVYEYGLALNYISKADAEDAALAAKSFDPLPIEQQLRTTVDQFAAQNPDATGTELAVYEVNLRNKLQREAKIAIIEAIIASRYSDLDPDIRLSIAEKLDNTDRRILSATPWVMADATFNDDVTIQGHVIFDQSIGKVSMEEIIIQADATLEFESPSILLRAKTIKQL